MYKSWKFKVTCAYLAFAAMLAGTVVGCGAVRDGTPISPNEQASAYVSNLPASKVMTDHKVRQITVLCEQEKPSASFLVQIGYWTQAAGPRTVQTNAPCKSWGTVMFLVPSKTGWQVNTVPDTPISADTVVTKVVADLKH